MPISNFITKQIIFRFSIALILGLAYLLLVRPVRATLSNTFVKPAAERVAEANPETMVLYGNEGAVSFVIYFLSEPGAETYTEVTFAFPFGFFLFAPLLFLLLIDKTHRYTIIHLVTQAALGLLMLLFFFCALWMHSLFFHLYNFSTAYLIPGAAFLVVLFSLMKENRLLVKRQN